MSSTRKLRLDCSNLKWNSPQQQGMSTSQRRSKSAPVERGAFHLVVGTPPYMGGTCGLWGHSRIFEQRLASQPALLEHLAFAFHLQDIDTSVCHTVLGLRAIHRHAARPHDTLHSNPSPSLWYSETLRPDQGPSPVRYRTAKLASTALRRRRASARLSASVSARDLGKTSPAKRPKTSSGSFVANAGMGKAPSAAHSITRLVPVCRRYASRISFSRMA